jgi:hypothetical protein
MNATMRFIVWGTIPLGQIVGGAIATTAGVNVALWVGGIGACTAFLWVLISPVLALREMPAQIETADGVAAVASGSLATERAIIDEALEETTLQSGPIVLGGPEDG